MNLYPAALACHEAPFRFLSVDTDGGEVDGREEFFDAVLRQLSPDEQALVRHCQSGLI